MIAHVDADCFFASVLMRKHPRLRGKPLLALGMGGGCVIAASYEAKAKGVKTGMRLSDARKLCPGAIEMPSDFNETALASEQIENILANQCPVMEEMSIDEWYLDLTSLVGGVPKDLEAWATATRLDILRKTAISVSIGTGPSKLLAKMAGEYRKPAGITVLNDSGMGKTLSIQAMLMDRPTAAIPGIGRAREVHVRAQGWETAWDIASASEKMIATLFGKNGTDIQQELNGHATSAVAVDDRPQQSISRARSFGTTSDSEYVWAQTLQHLSFSVLKMRKMDLSCGMIGIWMREGYEHGRGMHLKLPQLMATEQHLLPYLRRCFSKAWKSGFPCTQVAIYLGNLQSRSAQQLNLFVPAEQYVKDANLQTSLDTVRKRYGREAVILGGAMPVHEPEPRRVDLPILS